MYMQEVDLTDDCIYSNEEMAERGTQDAKQGRTAIPARVLRCNLTAYFVAVAWYISIYMRLKVHCRNPMNP